MQTSARHLSALTYQKLFNQLATLLADLHHPRQVRQFLDDFLTRTEKVVLSKRLAILWNLYQSKSYEEIKNQLKVSSATISSVNLIKDRKNCRHSIGLIAKDKFIEKIVEILSQLSGKTKTEI